MDGERCIDAEHLRAAATKLLCVDAPRAYQLRIARRLLEGENVLLQAPTGAGKTKGAL
jgi:Lhr-like helicase